MRGLTGTTIERGISAVQAIKEANDKIERFQHELDRTRAQLGRATDAVREHELYKALAVGACKVAQPDLRRIDGIDPRRRPDTLSIAEFVRLSGVARVSSVAPDDDYEDDAGEPN